MQIKKSILFCSLFGLTQYASAADFVFLDKSTLDQNYSLLSQENHPKEMKDAYEKTIEEAELAMKDGPFSVTEKGMTPPSGDKRDYMSISPYWWPDESKEDGLPWIRHDGKTNPASKTNETDSRRIGHFTRSVRALAIAYYFSKDEKYAEKGIEYIRTWFFDEKTKMNPNMNFAQGVPGVADGRRSGLIDSRSLADRMLDAIAMLSTSKHWTDHDEEAIKKWYTEYLDWLLTDDLSGGPKGAAFSENNHGSWYDLQVAGIALFLEKKDLAKKMVEKGKMRVDTQFEEDGSQPHEAARTRAYHYHYFNLDALTGIAQVGDKLDMDLWSYQSEKGASLVKGVTFMLPYNDKEKTFPYPQKGERRVERMGSIYLKTGLATNNQALIDAAYSFDYTPFTVKKNLAEVWVQKDIELLYPRQK